MGQRSISNAVGGLSPAGLAAFVVAVLRKRKNPLRLSLALLGLACAAVRPPSSSGTDPSATAPPPRSANSGNELAELRLIAFNDFHGNLLPLRENERPLGGAVTLAAYIRHFRTGFEERSLVLHAGDHVGASPPESGLFQDEPSMAWLSLLANAHCRQRDHSSEGCDVVGTLGNHEFDEGRRELQRLLFGGESPQSFQAKYGGSRVPYVSANVMDSSSGRTLLPAFVVRSVGGVQVGVIGAVLRSTPSVVSPAGVQGLEFLDEAQAINAAAMQLVGRGVHVIVLAIHQGLAQEPYEGPTRRGVVAKGQLLPIVEQLHEEIDVVVSGHTHAFTNVYLGQPGGGEVLVTQAYSAGRAVGVIDLVVERASGRVLSKAGQVHLTYGDLAPGNTPQPDVAELVEQVVERVEPRTRRVVGYNAHRLARDVNEHGESALGNLIADAQRAATGADFGVTNLGGIRGDLPAGPVTWGQLYAIQPFANHLLRARLTGKQLQASLERQWAADGVRFLLVSGLTYEWDERAPLGARIRNLRKSDGTAIVQEQSYDVALNSYLASGGDGFFHEISERSDAGQTDLEGLVHFFETRPQVEARIEGRVRRLH